MCGIAGYAGFDDASLLRAMCSILTHRGPDDDGFYMAPGVGLAQRRLSVIDLKTGHQPLANESGDVWVTFNGEIYNYEDLRSRLQRAGHTLVTTSDTETLVHLYEDHGLDFIQNLRGMFAIALWDAKRQRLVLVRDRIGEKPLFYSVANGQLLFASEIKAILQMPGHRVANPQAICDFLAAGYVGGSRTFYRDIVKVPPGHMVVFEGGQATLKRYWQHSHVRQASVPFEEASAGLVDRLTEAGRLCLKSDVEVGAFLSGGIDSSVIVALMRQQGARVKTFSVGYADEAEGFNELRYAKLVSRHLGTEHRELILGAGANIALLPRILWHYDEPHGEPTSVLVYQLCEFTRQHVKVALGGTGADEIFFGYPRHKGVRLLEYYRRLPRVLRTHLVERVVSRWPESTRGSRFAKRARRFIGGSNGSAEEAYLSWVSMIHADIRSTLVAAAVRSAADDPLGEALLRQHLLGRDGRDLLDRAADLDVEGYLPEFQLCYMDRMSMAHGLEVRAPFCDFELVEFVTGLPVEYRLRGGRSKHILKEVARNWIPRSIIDRRKIGFDSPIGQWFKNELRPFLLSFLGPDQIGRSGLLDQDTVQTMIRGHLAGRHDYSLQLWSLMALEGWYRMYIEDQITDGTGYQLSDLRGTSGAVPP
jgi:asparagine synthase (glutamine-hydrolysing)